VGEGVITHRVQDVIVGSGAGGGVLAARLAEAGRTVCVVEEGPRVSKADFNQREGPMYNLLYRDAGNQLTKDGAISVLQGRCLGGSTTVNQGDCVPIEAAVLTHWRQQFGWGDWGGISDSDVEAAASRALAEMGAGPIAYAELNANNRLLAEGAAKMGRRGEPLHHNRVGCVGSGYCMIGCAYDAKRGTLVAHLPRAEAAGAILLCDSRVDRVLTDGHQAVGVAGEGFEVRGERVFLCAGPIHTPGILHRSAIRAKGLGENLTLQPQAPTVAIFDEVVDFHRGIPQAWGLLDSLDITPEKGLRGFTIEPIAAGPSMTASLVPLPMPVLRPLLAEYRHLAAALCLVPDLPGGRVVPTKGRPKIDYVPSAEHRATLIEAMKTCARMYLAAGAREVRIPAVGAPLITAEADLKKIDDLSMRSNELPMISAHPQGTCRMGPNEDCVVGMDFGVRGVDSLYVADASLFPTSASTHTMVPVMSMAHLLADQLEG
jgi:choline dehydrogenase-like flavoprotein